MSAALKYISCPVSQFDLLEPIGVQTQVDSFKNIEYLGTNHYFLLGGYHFWDLQKLFSKGRTIIFLTGGGGGVPFFKGLDTIFFKF